MSDQRIGNLRDRDKQPHQIPFHQGTGALGWKPRAHASKTQLLSKTIRRQQVLFPHFTNEVSKRLHKNPFGNSWEGIHMSIMTKPIFIHLTDTQEKTNPNVCFWLCKACRHLHFYHQPQCKYLAYHKLLQGFCEPFTQYGSLSLYFLWD